MIRILIITLLLALSPSVSAKDSKVCEQAVDAYEKTGLEGNKWANDELDTAFGKDFDRDALGDEHCDKLLTFYKARIPHVQKLIDAKRTIEAMCDDPVLELDDLAEYGEYSNTDPEGIMENVLGSITACEEVLKK